MIYETPKGRLVSPSEVDRLIEERDRYHEALVRADRTMADWYDGERPGDVPGWGIVRTALRMKPRVAREGVVR